MSRATRTASMQTRGTPKNSTRKTSMAIIESGGSFQGLDEVGNGGADLVARVFLDEMQSGHGDLGLVRPGPAELPLLADQDRARFGVDEQLRRRVLAGEPPAVRLDVGHDVGRLTLDGDLAGPRERRPAAFPRLLVRAAIDVHHLLGQR